VGCPRHNPGQSFQTTGESCPDENTDREGTETRKNLLGAGCGSVGVDWWLRGKFLNAAATRKYFGCDQPERGGLTVTQTLTVTATIANDSSNVGVNWSATGGGSFSSSSSASGTPVTYTAPATAGAVTITATSRADMTKNASAAIGVTDLSGVLTYHNDLPRDGTNTREFALNAGNVSSATFGKLFSCTVDGAIYAQPLWIAHVTLSNVKRNVVIVATQHDSVYAFDADASPCQQLWHANLLDAGHGANPGESPVPSGTSGNLVGSGYGDITPEVGITGSPVIDPSANTLYVVGKSVIPSGPTFFQRLHALDLTTGSEKFNGPVNISAAVPGTGDGSSGGNVAFDPRTENQRPGLALVNGVVYLSWASHEDHDPYHGWVIGYSASTLVQVSGAVFNTTPNAVTGYSYSRGGIWMSGGAPAADASNNLYLITGNGTYDGVTNFGDSVLRLTTAGGLAAADWFTPNDQATLDANDTDFGSGGAVVLVDLPSPPPAPSSQHLLVGSGKDGNIFLLNRDSLGHFTATNSGIVQSFPATNATFSTPAIWQNTLYIAGSGNVLKAFTLDPSKGLFTPTSGPSATSHSPSSYGFPGASPCVSSSNATNGIIWAIDSSQYCTSQSPGCGPAVLHAYDATNLGTELWNSTMGAGNAAGNAVKFTVPTVANGKVYVGTRGNNTGGTISSTSIPGELDVYGLLPN
jgi:hypothetical protein